MLKTNIIILLLMASLSCVAQPDDVLMQEQVENYLIDARHGEAEAQYNLGLCYIYGNGVRQSYEEAAKWLETRRSVSTGFGSAVGLFAVKCSASNLHLSRQSPQTTQRE